MKLTFSRNTDQTSFNIAEVNRTFNETNDSSNNDLTSVPYQLTVDISLAEIKFNKLDIYLGSMPVPPPYGKAILDIKSQNMFNAVKSIHLVINKNSTLDTTIEFNNKYKFCTPSFISEDISNKKSMIVDLVTSEHETEQQKITIPNYAIPSNGSIVHIVRNCTDRNIHPVDKPEVYQGFFILKFKK